MFNLILKLRKYKLISIILVIILYSCANIQPPSGGPKDEEPPFITEFYPPDKTLNYNKDFVEIEFSEWVNRNQVVQNVMVSPVSEVSYKWSGRTLRIIFEKEKRENATYLISLGTQYSDNAGNKPDSAFSMTFSTGNTIDSGRIEGFVYGTNAAGSFIYAYRLNDKNPDTLNPEITPAEYRTQIGNNGSFSLLALPDGDYRIMVVKTQFRDNLFHPKTDEFGTYWENVKVEDGKAKFVIMKLGKYPDYSPISLNSVSKVDSNKILLEFNKLVKVNRNETKSSLEILDSAKLTDLGIKYFYTDSIFSKRLIIVTDKIISDITTAKVIIEPLFLIDTFKNKNTEISGYFRLSNRNYGSPFEFNMIPIKDSTQNVDNTKELKFSLNKSFSLPDTNVLELTNSIGSKSKLNIIIDGNALIAELNEPLLPEEWYKLTINSSKIVSIDGEKLSDRSLVINFKTIDWKQFPKVSGKLLDSVGCSNNIIALQSSQNPYYFQTKLKYSGDWFINEVKPDKYSIEIYCDENDNGRYDYGIAFPYEFAEKFLITKQEIEVKPRWEVQNVLLFFKLP